MEDSTIDTSPVTASRALLKLFPSTKYQSFYHVLCKELNKKGFKSLQRRRDLQSGIVFEPIYEVLASTDVNFGQ